MADCSFIENDESLPAACSFIERDELFLTLIEYSMRFCFRTIELLINQMHVMTWLKWGSSIFHLLKWQAMIA
jgi:hypothetical protein